MLGTAGWTGAFPLKGGIEFVFPWCGGRAPPTADSGLGAVGVVPGAAVGEAAVVVVVSAGIDVIRCEVKYQSVAEKGFSLRVRRDGND